ncbi:MAG: lipid-A-disaccharide synthase [Verrucomicrobia bacterium A1]|nr:MAG: lipid-A-disaccharide synthase [Verrucomicrobia bacterium A1]
MSKRVLVVAGEISGDMHAGAVVRSVLRRNPNIEFFGIGGEELHAAGVHVLHDVKEMAVLGIAEVIRRYGFFRSVFHEMLDLARLSRPDAILLVDYPGFNLRFAEQAHRMGLKVLYYVCPQVWAWHRSRIGRIARIVNRLIVIFPFETEVFAGTGLKVDFVGHPLVDETQRALAEPLRELPWSGEPRIALLPGSRRQEVDRILPPMAAAARKLQERIPGAAFLVAAPSEDIATRIRGIMAGVEQKPPSCRIMVGQTRQILRQARAAMVASGTATIETALMGCPMIVVYKTSAPTYIIGRMLVKISHLGMVNIVAGRTLCPEFIQGAATPDAMAAAMEPLVGDTPARAAMVAGLEEVRKLLGQGGAADRAADVILEELS